MKMIKILKKAAEYAVISAIFFSAPGCAQAHPEQLSENDPNTFSTHVNRIQILEKNRTIRRPEVFHELFRKMTLIRAAADRMRIPEPSETRLFYRLPEEKDMAFSIGDTRDGYMVSGRSLPAPSLLLRQLPVQYERGIAFGTQPLIDLLVDTARKMEKKYPESILYLGNMGLKEGGDIPYSISHNAGRDADIAFYYQDTGGHFYHPQNMYKVNRSLTAHTPEGTLFFDLEKNTSLVEALLTHKSINVQFIFIAGHLRSAIRNELVRRSASEDLLARFDETVQKQAAHNDHFHIRVYCSPSDICAGCIDRSIIHEWQADPVPIREACVQKYAKALSSRKTDGIHRAIAIQRLALLGEAGSFASKIVSAFSHDDAQVRNAAVLASRTLTESQAVGPLTERLSAETDENIRHSAIASLARFETPSVRTAFCAELERPNLSAQDTAVIANYIEHHPHEQYAKSLVAAAVHADESQLPMIAEALSVAANTPLCENLTGNACAEQAASWLETHSSQGRQQWLINGFRKAGFAVKKLDNADIPLLLDALDGPRPVSINARLILAKLSRDSKDTLGWSAADAKWHFTRYFKRNAKKYKIDLSDRDERGNKL